VDKFAISRCASDDAAKTLIGQHIDRVKLHGPAKKTESPDLDKRFGFLIMCPGYSEWS